MKALIISLFTLLLSNFSYLKAQNECPYIRFAEHDISIYSLAAFCWLFTPETKGLTNTEISLLNKNDINAFDRFAASNFSISAAQQSDYFLFGSFIYGGALTFTFPFFIKNTNYIHHLFPLMNLWVGTFLFCYSATDMVKANVLRIRPYVYNPKATFNKNEPDACYSFFSGHTSVTACNTFFAAKVFSDYFPESKLKPYVWTLASIIPAYTSYLRIKAGKHFPTDVLAGYIFGASCGYLLPFIYHKNRKWNKNVSINIYPSGLNLSWALK